MKVSACLVSLLCVLGLLPACDGTEGAACDAATGDAGCVKPLICTGNLQDCNGNRADGCESDTGRDANNCGACGKKCAGGANASPACIDAQCYLACQGAFLDCNKDPSDGCEIDAANDPGHCGSCYPCFGNGLASANVGCVSGSCTFSCRGDNYDINNNIGDGCEMPDNLGGGHDEASATRRPDLDCFDSDTDSFTGDMFSDFRSHTNPTLAGFDATVGAAPDFWVVHGTGGAFCVNDYSVTFRTTSGDSTALACYELTFTTDKTTQTITLDGNDSKTITGGASSYSSGTDILFEINKICPLTLPEAVTYTVSYHL